MMSTATATHPMIDQAKATTDQMKGRLLKTFSFVPDEKLTWSPEPTCKSALRLVAHCAGSNLAFARILRGESMPVGAEFDAMRAEAVEREKAVTTREEAIEKLEASVALVHAALDAMTPESIERMVEAPFPAPMTFYMFLPARHMDNHAAQIDMLQTCWGDMDWHV